MNNIGMRTVASLVLGLYDALYRRTLKMGFRVFIICIIASINRKVQHLFLAIIAYLCFLVF